MSEEQRSFLARFDGYQIEERQPNFLSLLPSPDTSESWRYLNSYSQEIIRLRKNISLEQHHKDCTELLRTPQGTLVTAG